MVPPDKHMILSLEQVLPQTDGRSLSSTTFSGFINNIVAIADEDLAGKLIFLNWDK